MHSILKTECICRQKTKSFSEANEMIERYIHFYNRSASNTKQEWHR
ncbi:MAG TPA: IS3 family transposase [Candidatus Gallacutalibacter pullistercoris]|nr:IS3 family transposase [Candidatus Gallacutalibacter pullistercoris]